MMTTDKIAILSSYDSEQTTRDEPILPTESFRTQPEFMATSTVPGNVYLVEEPGAPWLFLHAAKGQNFLTWICDTASYQLESTETLLAPISWRRVPESPLRSRRRFTVALPPSVQPCFFRLRKISEGPSDSNPPQGAKGQFQTLLGGFWFRGTQFAPAI